MTSTPDKLFSVVIQTSLIDCDEFQASHSLFSYQVVVDTKMQNKNENNCNEI